MSRKRVDQKPPATPEDSVDPTPVSPVKNRFLDIDKIDKQTFKSVLKNEDLKRSKCVDEQFEKSFREMSIESQQGSNQIGNARQKLDLEGNSLKIQKSQIKYEDSRSVVGIEKSLK